MTLTTTQQQQIAALLPAFPKILDQAVTDWNLLAAGYYRGLFTDEQRRQALAWFKDFPRLWETLKPNYEVEASGMISTHRAAVRAKAEAFVAKIKTAPPPLNPQLGIAPIIIAGILIAAAFGAAGAMWAVGYAQRQRNISSMIAGVVEGKLPPEVLREAVAHEGEGFLSDLSGLLKWAAIGGIALVALPLIRDLVSSRKAANA